jgi:hypothetical protein
MKKTFIFLCIVLSLQSFGQGKLLQKVLSKGLTSKTADLSAAAMQAAYITNLHSPAIETSTSKVVKDQWIEGKNLILLVTTKREGSGFLEIDGEVTIDGQPAPYFGFGIYGKSVDQADKASHTISVKTSSGQTANFVVAPAQPIKIASINGLKDKFVVDPEKDLDITLDNSSVNDGSKVSVKLYVKQAGVGYFNDFYVVPSTNKIHVPKEAFLHPGFIVGKSGYGDKEESVSSSNSLLPNFEFGDSYIMVERFSSRPEKIEGVGTSQQLSLAWDVKPVELKRTKEKRYFCLRINDEDKKMGMTYSIEKPNAFLGPTLASGKKFAIASVVLNASLSDTKVYNGDYATVWKTKYSPKFPKEYWESLLKKTYDAIQDYFANTCHFSIVPLDEAVKAPSYSRLPVFDEKQDKNLARYTYNGSRAIIARGIAKLKQDMNTTFASDRFDSRLCDELGVDGIIAARLDLVFDYDDETFYPEINIRVSGGCRTYTEGPVIYTQGSVMGGEGLKFKKVMKDPSNFDDFLANVIHLDGMMKVWDNAMKAQSQKEAEYGYNAIWTAK